MHLPFITPANPDILTRIVTLMLALGNLAETASMRSQAKLGLVLPILRLAIGIVRGFIAETMHDRDVNAALWLPTLDDNEPVAGRSAEAIRLAAEFRMLAALLHHLAACDGWPMPASARHRLLSAIECALRAFAPPDRSNWVGLVSACASRRAPYPDTS